MGYVSFAEIKQSVSIETVCEWYGVQLKKDGETLRGCCPIHKGDDPRAFVVTPHKQMFYCHGECKKGGDVIELVRQIDDVSHIEAAHKIAARVASPKPPEQKTLAELTYLQPNHDIVQKLGIPAELAKRLGIGFANKGVLNGYVLIPLREADGTLFAYVGIHPDKGHKLPRNLKGE